MITRDKLIDLIENNCGWTEERRAADLADRLIASLIANSLSIVEYTNVPAKWIPVEERLPEIIETKRAYKNVYRRSARVLCACKQADGKWLVKEGYMEFFNDYPEPNWRIPGTIHSVTHWIPLPQPPKGVE